MNFIGRKKELNLLRQFYRGKGFKFIVVYGRRRVGKTEVIKRFIRSKKGIYFLADQRSEIEQLRELGRIIGGNFNDFVLSRRGFADWLEVFEYLKNKVKGKFVFALDEYPYLAAKNKAINSIFQKGIDEYLKNTGIFLILCGSSVSFMEENVLGYKSPLYGRRTGDLHLLALNFEESWKFFPNYNFADFLAIYSITGGIPQYLLSLSQGLRISDNIQENIFKPGKFLYNEAEYLLKEELREPGNYLSVLKAISFGKTKYTEIANDTGIGYNSLMKYLSVLENLKLIQKEVPVTEKNPAKSKRGIYKIVDNYFRFWFRYVFPYKSDIEIGRPGEAMSKVKESFNLLKSEVYENICREKVWSIKRKPFNFERVGRWWDRDCEIDIVAFSAKEKKILFGEVKWSNKPVGENIYQKLKEKKNKVKWGSARRREYYILFSKSGFTEKLKEIAKKEPLILEKFEDLKDRVAIDKFEKQEKRGKVSFVSADEILTASRKKKKTR